MFELAYPWILMLLPLPWLIRYLVPASSDSHGSALRVPFYSRITILEKNSGFALAVDNRVRHAVLFLMWFALVLAACGPRYLGAPIALPQTGRAIMMALDISGSMSISDMEWDNKASERITVVKHLANRFVAEREGDQIGLILFGSGAYLQTPMTFDLNTVKAMLDDATIGLAGQQTAIGDAIGLAIKRLSKIPAKSRVLILLTDGANNAGTIDPIQAAKLAAEESIKIYTIGLGANKMLVPGLLGPQVINPSANLDAKALTEIASITGGEFFRAENTAALKHIYNKINQLEPVSGKSSVFRPVTEFYYIPLLITFLLGLYMMLTRIRRTQQQTKMQSDVYA